MENLNGSITLETCIEKLKFNKAHYDKKGLDMQIFFVAQLFNTSYKKIVEAMNC